MPAIQARAALYRVIRQFFFVHKVLEVDVPVLNEAATVDPFIDSLVTSVMGKTHYLQSSPEFFLKRFLAAYQKDCYCLGKAFRQGEKGLRHSPEFTLLEWYRVGWDEQQLIGDVRQLIQLLFPEISWQSFSYEKVFTQYTGLNPHTASIETLTAYAKDNIESHFVSEDKSTWLDLLFTHRVEPQLPEGAVVIYDYPVCQAALAEIEQSNSGQPVAKRFEVYLNGVELANGYKELTDGVEQERRFKADALYRQQNNLPELPYDHLLVEALKKGRFPSCAGVALGVDRLLMCQLNTQNISQVLSF